MKTSLVLAAMMAMLRPFPQAIASGSGSAATTEAPDPCEGCTTTNLDTLDCPVLACFAWCPNNQLKTIPTNCAGATDFRNCLTDNGGTCAACFFSELSCPGGCTNCDPEDYQECLQKYDDSCSSAPPSPPSPPSDKNNNTKLSTGAIVAIIVVPLLVVALAAAAYASNTKATQPYTRGSFF